MSILERALGAKPKPVDPAILQTRLADANRHIRELESQYAAVALEWASGGPTEAAKRDRLEADITAAKRDRDALTAALALAREAEAARERENAAALRAKQVRAVVQHLRGRTRAAAELSAAIAQAASAFKAMIEASEKANAACPIGSAWPMGSLCSFGELKKLTEAELYRHGGDPSLSHARSFPGADARDFTKAGNPASLTPIVDALQAADDFVINVLKGRQPATPATLPTFDTGSQGTDQVEPSDYDPADLLPGTHSAAEIQASVPKVQMSLDNE